MKEDELTRTVSNLVLRVLAGNGIRSVPAGISGRHVHLSRGDLEKLFGAGHRLRPRKALSQPGQFACEETVTLAGPKGSIEGVRVLGPERGETQVEISVTDAYRLGVKPVVRMSGNLNATPGIRLIGPAGETELSSGTIVAERHLHLSEEEAAAYGLKDGDAVSLRKSGARPIVFEGVIVRAGKGHSLEAHLDTDEGNAAGISSGDLLEVVEPKQTLACEPKKEQIGSLGSITQTATIGKGALVTEEILARYAKEGTETIQIAKGAHITPLAKDKAWELGLTIEMA